jgi:hypothetical protein
MSASPILERRTVPPGRGVRWHECPGYYDGVAATVTQLDTAVVAPLDTDKGWWIGKVDHPDFGADGEAAPDFFKGLIDEVEIFSVALTEADIQAIYEAGSAGKCEGAPAAGEVLSWWPGDDNAFDVADGNDGAPEGARPLTLAWSARRSVLTVSTTSSTSQTQTTSISRANSRSTLGSTRLGHRRPDDRRQGQLRAGGQAYTLHIGFRSRNKASMTVTESDAPHSFTAISGTTDIPTGVWTQSRAPTSSSRAEARR